MATNYKSIEQVKQTAAQHGLQVIRLTFNPNEYRVYSKTHQDMNNMVFQGDEHRTSDFVAGWIARIESTKT